MDMKIGMMVVDYCNHVRSPIELLPWTLSLRHLDQKLAYLEVEDFFQLVDQVERLFAHPLVNDQIVASIMTADAAAETFAVAIAA
jgi:hypothetical protein